MRSTSFWIGVFAIALTPLSDPPASLREQRERFYSTEELRFPPHSGDRAEDLVDVLRYRTLEGIRSAGLESARLDVSPWTDSYWPYYAGLIAFRYLDPAVPKGEDFLKYYEYLRPSVGQLDPIYYSPAEKYDLLVGDPQFSLTRTLLSYGMRKYKRDGKVEPWMGLCYGASAAAIAQPRPSHSVNVLAADGKTMIEFLPSDIKALGTLLWNANRFPRRFIGWRCNSMNGPSTETCLDTNPGTWHLAVVNQIGVSRRSFAMDAAYDYEVWNHPVVGYQYRFFNPRTGEKSENIEDNRVTLSSFPEDKYYRYRSRKAVSIIGVEMKVTIVMNGSPSKAATDDEKNDRLKKIKLRYDLELDSHGQIIGGEWYRDFHPDFLWVPLPNTRATSVGDKSLPRNVKWPDGQPIPHEWLSVAKKTSEQGQPLAAIVERLFALSR